MGKERGFGEENRGDRASGRALSLGKKKKCGACEGGQGGPSKTARNRTRTGEKSLVLKKKTVGPKMPGGVEGNGPGQESHGKGEDRFGGKTRSKRYNGIFKLKGSLGNPKRMRDWVSPGFNPLGSLGAQKNVHGAFSPAGKSAEKNRSPTRIGGKSD